MPTERRRLFVGTGWTLASTLAVLAVGVVLRPVAIIFVGVGGYGVWIASLAIASLAGLLGDFGASAALTRIIAERGGKGEVEGTAVTSSLVIGLFAGGFAGVGLFISAPLIERSLGFPGLAQLLQIQGAQLPVNLGVATLFGYLQGRRNFRLLATFTAASAIGNLLLALSLLSVGLGVLGLVLASFIASTALLATGLIHARNHLLFARMSELRRDATALIPFGATLTATNALSTLLYQLDVVVLIVLLGEPVSIGIYAIAVFVTRALWIIPGSISVTTYPTVSGYAASGDNRRLSVYVTTTLVATVAVTGALAAALVAFGRPLITLVFGPEASPAYELAVLLLPGTAALGSVRSIAASITGVGRPDIGLMISATGLGLLLVLLVILVPVAAGHGAAVAVSLSYATIAGILVLAVRQYVGPLARKRSELFRVSGTCLVALVSCVFCLAVALPVAFDLVALAGPVIVWGITTAALYVTSGGRATWGGLLKGAPRTSAGGPEP